MNQVALCRKPTRFCHSELARNPGPAGYAKPVHWRTDTGFAGGCFAPLNMTDWMGTNTDIRHYVIPKLHQG